MSFIPNPSVSTPGAAVPNRATYAGGTDGTNLRPFLTDTTGRQKVLLYDAAGNTISSTSSALDENVKSIGGTAVDVNAGNASAGTQRVILATNQPSLANMIPAGALRSGDIPTQIHVADLVSFTNLVSGSVTLFTGAPRFYINGIHVNVGPLVTTGVAGTNFISLTENSLVGIFAVKFFCPSVAPTYTTPTSGPVFSTPPGFAFRATLATSNVVLAVGTALTADSIFVTVSYGLTAV